MSVTCATCPGMHWNWDRGIAVSDDGKWRVPMWGMCPRGYGSKTSHRRPDGTMLPTRWRNFKAPQCEVGPPATLQAGNHPNTKQTALPLQTTADLSRPRSGEAVLGSTCGGSVPKSKGNDHVPS